MNLALKCNKIDENPEEYYDGIYSGGNASIEPSMWVLFNEDEYSGNNPRHPKQC